MYGSHASLPFLVSIVVFGLCLLFAGITDQRLLRTYISKKTLAAGAALMSAGTLLLLATPVISGPALEVGTQALRDLDWQAAMRKTLGQEMAALEGVLRAAGLAIHGGSRILERKARREGADGGRVCHGGTLPCRALSNNIPR